MVIIGDVNHNVGCKGFVWSFDSDIRLISTKRIKSETYGRPSFKNLNLHDFWSPTGTVTFDEPNNYLEASHTGGLSFGISLPFAWFNKYAGAVENPSRLAKITVYYYCAVITEDETLIVYLKGRARTSQTAANDATSPDHTITAIGYGSFEYTVNLTLDVTKDYYIWLEQTGASACTMRILQVEISLLEEL